jgi:hypothetical protein
LLRVPNASNSQSHRHRMWQAVFIPGRVLCGSS